MHKFKVGDLVYLTAVSGDGISYLPQLAIPHRVSELVYPDFYELEDLPFTFNEQRLLPYVKDKLVEDNATVTTDECNKLFEE